jgi:pseudouridine-5'-phosphate glycosidase
MSKFDVHVSEEVQDAIADNRPVLALESTIFTHGLPRPRNAQVALESEKELREAGVTPATIGVVNGLLTVGLSQSEIESLSNDDDVVKASIRDLPICAAKGLSAGTTVAATAFAAHAAGIKVFSTGGLGGVHQGASETFDESADLIALAHVPIVVVSAGVKSILDIRATLERLETLNVPVVGWKTTKYPGFYISDSGVEIEYSVDSVEEVAEIVKSRDALKLSSTVLVANPIPVAQQLDPAELDRVLIQAHAAAEQANIVGHDTTPFLLDYIQRATGGESLEVNIKVYKNNVALGGLIAQAL